MNAYTGNKLLRHLGKSTQRSNGAPSNRLLASKIPDHRNDPPYRSHKHRGPGTPKVVQQPPVTPQCPHWKNAGRLTVAEPRRHHCRLWSGKLQQRNAKNGGTTGDTAMPTKNKNQIKPTPPNS